MLLTAYQNIPPAPGRDSGTTQAPSTPPPGGNSPPPDGLGGGGLLPLLMMVVPMLLLLFFTSRSQQKKQAAALASLKKGDRVLTQSGLVGKLVEMDERFVKLEISPGVKVEILKSQILGADNPKTQATAEKK